MCGPWWESWDGERLGRIRFVGTEKRWVAIIVVEPVEFLKIPTGCACHANCSCF
jgi:hypothetical protein